MLLASVAKGFSTFTFRTSGKGCRSRRNLGVCVGKKEKNKRGQDAYNDQLGDCYCWVAIERNTKLVLAYVVGRRSVQHAFELMRKLRQATSPVEPSILATDGLAAYLPAVDEMISDRCDLPNSSKFTLHLAKPISAIRRVRLWRRSSCDQRKSQPETHLHIHREAAKPHDAHAHAETDQTNECVQQKFDSHKAAIALHFAHYNFVKIHKTLRVTPAMEAGITDHVWSIAELLA